MAARSNQRRNLRVFCTAVGRAEGPRGPVKGTVRNLSQGGMFFLGAQLPLGKSCDFQIELPSGKIAVQGEVRYSYSYPEGTGVGVKFSRISQDDLKKVIDFVDANKANEVPQR
jgi:hypothetical protein